jgi:hypothetical protein
MYSIIATSLNEIEQARMEMWLSIITMFLLGLVVFLLGLGVAIRYIAKRSTQPCRWCMEFISKTETVCPRCGRALLEHEDRVNAGTVPDVAERQKG